MVAASSDRIFLSPTEYLEWEPRQEFKHEYVDGEAFAMTGGTLAHNDIAVNLITALKNRLRGKGCKPRMADAKVGITPNGPFFYPDVLVTCDRSDLEASKCVLNPCFICEVLSDTTEAYDRGNKFSKGYRGLQSLKEYLLVKQDEVNVDLRRLNERGVWEIYFYGEGDEIRLESIDFDFPVSLLYEDVRLPIAEAQERE
jgi:Uma2 family endonuclease